MEMKNRQQIARCKFFIFPHFFYFNKLDKLTTDILAWQSSLL